MDNVDEIFESKDNNRINDFINTIISENVDMQNNETENTILISACLYERFDLIDNILEHKANPNIRNKESCNALWYAITDNSPTSSLIQEITLKFLKYGADINSINNKGMTILHQYAREGTDIQAFKFLIDNKADINIKDMYGSTALYDTCCRKEDSLSRDMIQILINNGADINIQTITGKQTALHYACGWGLTKTVQLLVNNGANIYLLDKYGDLPFHRAVKQYAYNTLKYLISIYKNVNMVDNDGFTLLHNICVYRNHTFDQIQLLLDNNADISIQINEGWTVLHILCDECDDTTEDNRDTYSVAMILENY